MVERIKDARPMMDLMAKKVFSNPEITAQFIRDILDLPVHHVKILDGTQIHNHQFEDIKIRGIKEYDKYLHHLYGDYMQLPSVNARKIHFRIVEIHGQKIEES